MMASAITSSALIGFDHHSQRCIKVMSVTMSEPQLIDDREAERQRQAVLGKRIARWITFDRDEKSPVHNGLETALENLQVIALLCVDPRENFSRMVLKSLCKFMGLPRGGCIALARTNMLEQQSAGTQVHQDP